MKDSALTSKLIVDAKTNCSSPYNAMDTLLLHKDTLQENSAGSNDMSVLMIPCTAGVKYIDGPKSMKAGLCNIEAKEIKCEYGDLTYMVEIVENMVRLSIGFEDMEMVIHNRLCLQKSRQIIGETCLWGMCF